MFLNSLNQPGEAMPVDPYANDIARHLSVSGSSSEDVIASLRNMNLGDNFWMYSFKVVPCAKTFSHKWTLCPCAHAGETARRRDPRFHPYRAVLCPLVKVKKNCPMGDNCMWSHNIFEHWLHPSRYKTRLCSFGRNCNRPICFFAHGSEELRCVPHVDDGKELDEREYLMQLMLAQEAGILPPGTVQEFTQPASQPSSHRSAMDGTMLMNGMRGMSTGGTPMHMQNRTKATARTTVATAAAGAAPAAQQLDPASLLLGLQESLANYNMGGMDPNYSMSGGEQGWPGNSLPAARISDPGLPHHPQMLAAAAINPIRHLNRISDSGQTLGLVCPRGLVDLEQLLNNALASANLQIPPTASSSTPGSPEQTSPLRASPPPTSTSPSNSHHSSASCPLPVLPSGPAGSPEVPQRGPSSSGAAAAASATNNPADSYVKDLVAQLQEQGIVNSKEQLVASLSQLLAQLLV